MSVSRERRRAWRDRTGICERILVVDGDEGTADATGLALLSNGYDVAIATTARHARRLLDEEQFELVLCDVRLPGECGLALVQELRRMRPDLAIVVTAEVDDAAAADEALDAGALDYVVKPWRVTDLLVAISFALRQRRDGLRSTAALQLASTEIERQRRLLEAVQLDAVERLARAVELRDPHIRGHHGRVAHATGQLARTIGMSDAQSDLVGAASLLHDVGKIGIPDRILSKPAPLTETERKVVECHTTIGHTLLANSCHPVLKAAAAIALSHHERLDGSGYPHGLRGRFIPLEARMVAITDTYDALTSDRPYRGSHAPDDALCVIQASAGELFDPDLVDAFVSVIEADSDVRQRHVEWARDPARLEGRDQDAGVPDLAAAAAAQEPAELLARGASAPRRLFLQRPEGPQVAMAASTRCTSPAPTARISSSSRSASQTPNPSRSMSCRVRSLPRPARSSRAGSRVPPRRRTARPAAAPGRPGRSGAARGRWPERRRSARRQRPRPPGRAHGGRPAPRSPAGR